MTDEIENVKRQKMVVEKSVETLRKDLLSVKLLPLMVIEIMP